MRGHWAVYFTSPQNFKIRFLYVGITTLGNLICWFIKLCFQTFEPLNIIYRRGNIVYQFLGCISIYRPLSYPFRFLKKTRQTYLQDGRIQKRNKHSQNGCRISGCIDRGIMCCQCGPHLLVSMSSRSGGDGGYRYFSQPGVSLY